MYKNDVAFYAICLNILVIFKGNDFLRCEIIKISSFEIVVSAMFNLY